MRISFKVKRQIGWIIFGLFSIGLRSFFANYPIYAENFYSRFFFLGIRWIYDYLFFWLPFPWIYLFIIGLLYLFFLRIKALLKSNSSWQTKMGNSLLAFCAFIFGGVGLFLWVWGFNYNRISVEDQLSLDLTPLGLKELKAELDLETKKVIALRTKLYPDVQDSIPLAETDLPLDYQKKLKQTVKDWLAKNNFPSFGSVRGREIYPKGIFLRFSSSGLYFPFTGEGHVDAGVHPLQKPYIVAHEMFHGYGFGDEGTCNFNAYLACIQSSDPFIAYSGHLSYWRTLAVNYLRYRPEEYRSFRRELPLTIQADLDAINEVLLSYPDIMPRFRYYAYDAYLKAQGIDEGMKNYNRIIMLVYAWRKQKRT